MNVPLALSLWLALALIMSSSCAETGRQQEQELEVITGDYDYVTPTGTPDYYDYNATFDYYYVTERYENTRSKASTIGRLIPELLLGLAALHMWH